MTIEPVTAERWDDLADLMGERGDSSRCWCQFYRSLRYGQLTPPERQAALGEQVTSAIEPLGLLAYADDRPIGWCAVAPRADHARLERVAAARATSDEPGLWSVTCFVIRVSHRRQGVAGALLDAAVAFARQHGARAVEAYPVDPAVRTIGSSGLFQGPLPLYLAAGFTVVARPSRTRATVRLVL